jgi:hypothetical protein
MVVPTATVIRNGQNWRASYPLTMQPVMWTHSGEVIRPTDPAMRYKVFDERGSGVAFITNTRATSRPASWQISLIIAGHVGTSTGDYAAAEDALTALRKEFD